MVTVHKLLSIKQLKKTNKQTRFTQICRKKVVYEISLYLNKKMFKKSDR